MMKKILSSLILAGALSACAETHFLLGEGLTLRLGGDIRARYEGYSQGAVQPDADKNGRHHTEYLRVRTRFWGALDWGEDLTFNLRLGNRFHKVTTGPNARNDNGTSTWEFPDEVYVDAANVVIRNLLGEHLQLTLGRQNLAFGNGMILSEGTPFDQGRSLYNDGVSARLTYERDTLTFFVFYDEWKDRCVFLNDQNRRLRSADIFTSGVYWTHSFSDAVNLDSYYMFNDMDDPQAEEAERGHSADFSGDIHTFGARIFGKPAERFDYSLEHAWQFGHLARHRPLQASMLDARVNFLLNPSWGCNPKITLNYTRFSGDEPGTKRQEGWIPLMTECPLWGDELIPIMLNGNWTNLNAYRAVLEIAPVKKLRIALAATEYFADERRSSVAGVAPTGGGSHFGLLWNLSASYPLKKWLALHAQVSHFQPGEYFANGQDSTWARFELTLSF